MQGSRRAGIALLGAVLALGVAPGLASACERPDSGDLGGGPARAGDTVTIALPSGCEGAYWSVSLEGAETNGAGGSLIFTVPDLGDAARDVTGAVTVYSSGAGADSWSGSVTIAYEGHKPAAAAPPPVGPRPAPRSAAPRGRQAPILGEVLGIRAESPAPRRSRSRRPASPVRHVASLFQGLGRSLNRRSGRGADRRARRRAARARAKADRYLRALDEREPPKERPAERAAPAGLPADLPNPAFHVAWQAALAVAVLGLLLALTLATMAGQRERRARRSRLAAVEEPEARELEPV